MMPMSVSLRITRPADWYDESPRELISKKPASEIREFFEAKMTPQLRLV